MSLFHSIMAIRRRHPGVLAALALLLVLLPLGAVQREVNAAAPAVHGGIHAYLDSVEVVAGGAFETILHADNVPGPGLLTGLGGYGISMTYDPAKLTFPVLSPPAPTPACGVTGIALGAPTAVNCFPGPNIGPDEIRAVDAETPLEGPNGNLNVLKYAGTADMVASSTTAVMTLATVDLLDPDANSYANVVTANGTITIWVAPVASFAVTCTDANLSGTCDAGEVFQFTDTSTNMTPAGAIRPASPTWSWDFGDGNVSSAQNPTHTYTLFPTPDPVTGNETYSGCLTVSNLAGSSGPVCQNVIVEPGAVTSVAVSPNNPTLQPAQTQDFSADGADQYGNPIPDGVLAVNGVPMSLFWTADPALGTIDANGLLTVLAGSGTFLNGVCVDAMYKGGAAMDCTDVMILSIQALIGLDKTTIGGLNPFAVLLIKILDTQNPTTGLHEDVAGGIQSYSAQLTYNTAEFKIQDVVGVPSIDTTWGDPLAELINNPGGVTTFNDIYLPPPVNQAPDTVAGVYLHLLSCTNQLVTIMLTFTQILDGDGNPIPVASTFSKSFRRGDAKSPPNGVVDMADALYIAQGVAGTRPFGQLQGQVHPINAATVKEDSGGDKVTAADFQQIAQRAVGLRNDCFGLITGATPPVR